jgi:hypothetical protein
MLLCLLMYVGITDKYIQLPLLLFLDIAMIRIPDYSELFLRNLDFKTEINQFYVVKASKPSPNYIVYTTFLQITGKNMRIFAQYILIPIGVLLVFVHRY